MSSFDGIEDAKIFESAKKMKPGCSYLLRIRKMSERKSGRDNTTILPVEFEVIETDDPTSPPGTIVGWVPKQKHGHAYLSNLLAFTAAVCGKEPGDSAALAALKAQDPTDTHVPKRSYVRRYLEEACSEANTFAGLHVRARAGEEQQTKSGFAFVPIYFSPA